MEPFESASMRPARLRIPLLGRIAAGSPIEAVEVPDEFVDLTESLDAGGDVFALQVKGLSMIDDHIDDGDIVVIRRQAHASNGDTVVALLKDGPSSTGEATLKRFYREKGGKIRLQPRNDTIPPIIVKASEVAVQGKVIAVLRHV